MNADLTLLTRRVADPLAELPGFPEVYACTKCRDYFVMAWHDRSSPIAKDCQVIQPANIPLGANALNRQTIFCPQCRTDYSMYGLIPGSPHQSFEHQEVVVYETFDFPYPRGVAPATSGVPFKDRLRVEQIVFILTGEFPPETNSREFTYAVADHGLAGFPADWGAGSVRLHLVRTNIVSDDTEWLSAFLRSHLYTPQTFGNRMFVTRGPFDMRPPCAQLLVCLVMFPLGQSK